MGDACNQNDSILSEEAICKQLSLYIWVSVLWQTAVDTSARKGVVIPPLR